MLARILTPGYRDRDAQISEDSIQDTLSKWMRRTGQKYGDELRHLNRTRSVVLQLTGVTFRLILSISKSPSDIPDYGTFPWETSALLKTNGDYLKKCQFTPKIGNQNFNPSASGTRKCKCSCYHHREGSCNFNQSRGATRGTFTCGEQFTNNPVCR